MRRIYFDICCYNRPFDDQNRIEVRLEADAKLHIQELVKDRKLELIWSFVLDYEKKRIIRFRPGGAAHNSPGQSEASPWVENAPDSFALKGQCNRCVALSGRLLKRTTITQGVALGYYALPLRGGRRYSDFLIHAN